MKSKFKIIKLGDLIKEVSFRNNKKEVSEVFSVTNSEGFVKSTDYFGKEVFSKNISNYKIVKPNQFAYNPSRINVGSIDFLRTDFNVVVSPLYVLFECKNELMTDYLLRYLKSPVGNSQIRNKTRGAVRDNLSFTSLSQIDIPLPSRKEQGKIVNLLSNIEEVILKRKKSIKLIDDLLKSIFHQKFIIKNIKFKKLEELVLKVTDGEHKKPDYKETGKPFISVTNITNGYLDFTNCKFVSDADFEKFTRRCNPGIHDILYSKVGATYGKAVIVDSNIPFCLYVSVALIKPNRSLVNPFFLKHALNHPFVKRQADKAIKGAGVPDLHLIEIKSFNIPLPSMKEQNIFAEQASEIEKTKTKISESLQELELLYSSVSSSAFRGLLDLTSVQFSDINPVIDIDQENSLDVTKNVENSRLTKNKIATLKTVVNKYFRSKPFRFEDLAEKIQENLEDEEYNYHRIKAELFDSLKGNGEIALKQFFNEEEKKLLLQVDK